MRLLVNLGYSLAMNEVNSVDGVVVHTSAADSARSLDVLDQHIHRLHDPDVYLWNLDCSEAPRTCAYIATYPWVPVRTPPLDEFTGRREWMNGGIEPIIDTLWPPQVPTDPDEIVRACLEWQDAKGATSLIAPAPLIGQVHDGLTEYVRWLRAAERVLPGFDKPVLMTVAFSDACFPSLTEGLLDLLTATQSFAGYYVAMETSRTSPYIVTNALADTLLEIAYHIGHRQQREVVVNSCDSFGLVCGSVGANALVAGYSTKHRRLSLEDYGAGGGSPFPRFFSLRTFSRYLPEADMGRIRKEGLLSEFLSERTVSSGSYLDALGAGQQTDSVLEWQERRGNTVAAKSHYLQRLKAEVDVLHGLPDITSRAKHVRQLLVQADSLSSLLRETFADEPLDEDGAHVRVWRHVFNRFGQRYGLFDNE